MVGEPEFAFVAPIAHLEQIDRRELNRCLTDWGHRMGPLSRPAFAIDSCHALFQHGEPVAITAASDTVREVVGSTGLRRDEVVELARLCAARRDLCRPMLRLWREMLLPAIAEAHGRWAAVSYQDEALHSGDIYRFDGWMLLGRAGRGGAPDKRTGRIPRRMKVWGWPVAQSDRGRLSEVGAVR